MVSSCLWIVSGSNACDFWIKVFKKRTCLLHTLAEDPEALGDGRATNERSLGQ